MRKLFILAFSGLACFAQIDYHQIRITPDSTFSSVGEIDFAAQNNGNYIGLAAPATLSANTVFHLPAADGTPNQLMCTDGSGNLGWCGASGLTPPVTISGSTSSPILTITQSGSGAGLSVTGAVAGNHLQNVGVNDSPSFNQVNGGGAGGTSGVQGTTTSNLTYGVYGVNSNSGVNNGGAGVYGFSNGATAGVLGTSTSGYGVMGSGPSGLSAEGTSNGGFGVDASELGTSGYALYGDAPHGAYSLYLVSGPAYLGPDNLTGAHAQNLGTSDNPTFNNLTVTSCTGCGGGGSYTGGAGISISGTTISNSGVTALSAGTGVSVSASTGSITVSIGQAVSTTSAVTFGSVTSSAFAAPSWNYNNFGADTWTASAYYVGATAGITGSTCSAWTSGLCTSP